MEKITIFEVMEALLMCFPEEFENCSCECRNLGNLPSFPVQSFKVEATLAGQRLKTQFQISGYQLYRSGLSYASKVGENVQLAMKHRLDEKTSSDHS